MSGLMVCLEGAQCPLEAFCTEPAEAEAEYLRLCRTSTSGPGRVTIAGPGVLCGEYRTDKNWPVGQPREQSRDRWAQIWARPDQGWTGPTAAQIRAALTVAGLTQTEAARRLGVSPRAVRYWLAGQRRIDWPAWAALMAWAGHKIY